MSDKISRRALFGGGAAVVASTGLGFAAVKASQTVSTIPDFEFLSPFGVNQPGVTAPSTAHIRYQTYNLKPEVNREALGRMFNVLTKDIEALTLGVAPLTDQERELAQEASALSITVGFGAGLIDRVDKKLKPEWLKPLPSFSRDRLNPDYGEADLLIVVASDDPTTLAHASRAMLKSVRFFATPVWRQDGFRFASASKQPERTMRNLMGQADGTSNPEPGTTDFDEAVWVKSGWLAGGTALVLRRIEMNLETWDMIDRPVREQAMGRDLKVGAPLTGIEETDAPDFEAKDALGFHVIPDFSHIRRASMGGERIYRRSVNYDDDSGQGLLFVSFGRDPLSQYVPIQERLDKLDLMNEWITHVGSSVFAIAPGWQSGGTLGESLLA